MKIYLSSDGFFEEAIQKAGEDLKIQMPPTVESYLVNMMIHYLDANNLFEKDLISESGKKKPQTLAEMYLTAQLEEDPHRQSLLRRMADRSLYISGFFADSLNRKIVDIDYYMEMGGTAYGILASSSKVDTDAMVYRTFSSRFLQFVDILTHISQNSLVHSNQSLLNLYDRYLKTGSEVARDKLAEMGIVTVPRDQAKLAKPS
ncbi:MAG: hypothetical protein V4736_07990 [Bdellovibrionota bacterium]